MQNYFSTNIRFIREQRGLTQEQLASIIGKDYSTIGKWENGTRSPIMEDVLKIADILDIPIEELLTKDLRMIQSNEQIKKIKFGDMEVTLSKNGNITNDDLDEAMAFILAQKMKKKENKDQ